MENLPVIVGFTPNKARKGEKKSRGKISFRNELNATCKKYGNLSRQNNRECAKMPLCIHYYSQSTSCDTSISENEMNI